MQVIEKNTRIRLKIVGTRVDATEIVSLDHFPDTMPTQLLSLLTKTFIIDFNL